MLVQTAIGMKVSVVDTAMAALDRPSLWLFTMSRTRKADPCACRPAPPGRPPYTALTAHHRGGASAKRIASARRSDNGDKTRPARSRRSRARPRRPRTNAGKGALPRISVTFSALAARFAQVLVMMVRRLCIDPRNHRLTGVDAVHQAQAPSPAAAIAVLGGGRTRCRRPFSTRTRRACEGAAPCRVRRPHRRVGAAISRTATPSSPS